MANSVRRKIYAIDTEATPDGKMLLIADNEGNMLDFDDLTPKNMLEFLFSKRYETSWSFFWNISYDTRIILRLLGNDILKQRQKRSRLTFKAFGYTISVIEKKVLSIKKGHHSVNFFDISQFYPQKKLSEAYEKNIRTPDMEYLAMKNKRSSFSSDYYRNHRREIREYCVKDCVLTKELADHWADLFNSAFKFYPQRWISSGYLAEKILINQGIYIPRFEETPDEVNEIATNATFGGRIDLIVRGHVPYVHVYDINSAYPFALSKIPDITKGVWIQSDKIEKNSLLGFFKIKCNIPRTKHISPFPFKVRSKIIYPNGEFTTFVTLAELQACEDPSWYEILDSWQYIDKNPSYPYKEFVESVFKQRQELKAQKNPLELPFKILLNSIYGKTGQTINSQIGNMMNPVIFATITGMTRAFLYKFIIGNKIERDVCMIYTDSITTTRNLGIDSKKIGDFSLDAQGEAYLLQNGFYRVGEKFRNKGIGKVGNETIEDTEPFEEDGRIKYRFTINKVGTLKENLAKGEFDKIGKFYTVTKDLNINADRGRFWIGRLTDVRKKETNYSTPFSFPEFSPDEI